MRQLTILPDFASWQKQARIALAAEWNPRELIWEEWGDSQPGLSLFDEADSTTDSPSKYRVPKAFIDLARTVSCHSSTDRWAVLYSVLWRITHGEPKLLEILVDPDVYTLSAMQKSIRHDIHKMRAFVRFREVKVGEESCYIAWFEPMHHIVEANANFFVNRFASMKWSILTPDRCAHWNGEKLSFTDGVAKELAPKEDAIEPLWLTYYSHIFNPARVKEAMMQSEMPKKYWKNLPEAALIPTLLQEAPKRVLTMHQSSADKKIPTEFFTAEIPNTDDLHVLRDAAATCKACPLYKNATQTVWGEGLEKARIVFVGEQPGDQEDLAGQPFVGPAGQLFNRAMQEIGLDRSQCYVTNAVKHFKWEPRGTRRLHMKPTSREVAACRPWVEAELKIIQPEWLICLGATAATSLLGKDIKITQDRGRIFRSAWAEKTMVTFHPSALLRAPDEATKKQNYAHFLADLAQLRG